MQSGQSRRTQILCEGAISVALGVVLSYLKIEVGAQGGSLNFAMIPLILFAVHSGGVGWGVAAGFVFGVLKYFLAGGFAITWGSMILDYSVAFAAVGLAGLFRGRLGTYGYLAGALVGCAGRYIIHYISGVTIYAEYAESVYFGIMTPTPWVYSLVYNAVYMVFNTIAALIICPILGAALARVKLSVRRG